MGTQKPNVSSAINCDRRGTVTQPQKELLRLNSANKNLRVWSKHKTLRRTTQPFQHSTIIA
jgi:hypothetical protein